jgi:hypothetical protein
MLSSRRSALVTLAFGVVLATGGALAPASVAAQAPPPAAADSMAFPRQAVKWFQSSQADSLFSHAGEELKTSMQSSANAATTMKQMASRFGEHTSTDAEVQFEDQDSRVFIAVSTYSAAPEQVAIIVRYTPGQPVIRGFSITSLSRAKERFPAAKLP